MTTGTKHPKWWQVYVMLPLLVSLFLPEMRVRLTETEHIIAQLGILFLIFGFMQLWLRANRSALMDIGDEEGIWRVHIHEIPSERQKPLEDVGERARERPLLRIPAAGLKGALSNTFEWDVPEGQSSVYADQETVSRKE